MDQIEEVPAEFGQYKNEQCIQIKSRDGIRTGTIVLTNPVSFLNYYSNISIICISFVVCLFKLFPIH